MKRITKIEENRSLDKKEKLRVAAYCRVSTASDEQLVSLAAQKAHYENYIKSNDEWEFAGLYYDEGVSGIKKQRETGCFRWWLTVKKEKSNSLLQSPSAGLQGIPQTAWNW